MNLPSGVWISENFFAGHASLYQALLDGVTWNERLRARKTASFGQPYNYSGVTYDAVPFPDLLLPLLAAVNERLGYASNNCLANFYPSGEATMGFHADSTSELAVGTGIASVSLGAARAITFRANADKSVELHLLLPPGSLLFMASETQQSWKHGLLPSTNPGGRISLTFRQIREANAVPPS